MSDEQIKHTDYYRDALINGANEDDAVSIAREQAKKDVASQGRLLGAGVGAFAGVTGACIQLQAGRIAGGKVVVTQSPA